MNAPPTTNCGDCAFWFEFDWSPGMGACRIVLPPQYVERDEGDARFTTPSYGCHLGREKTND